MIDDSYSANVKQGFNRLRYCVLGTQERIPHYYRTRVFYGNAVEYIVVYALTLGTGNGCKAALNAITFCTELDDKVEQAMSPHGLFTASGMMRFAFCVVRGSHFIQIKEVIRQGSD